MLLFHCLTYTKGFPAATVFLHFNIVDVGILRIRFPIERDKGRGQMRGRNNIHRVQVTLLQEEITCSRSLTASVDSVHRICHNIQNQGEGWRGVQGVGRRNKEEKEKKVPKVYSSIFPLPDNASISWLWKASQIRGIGARNGTWGACERCRRGREKSMEYHIPRYTPACYWCVSHALDT